VQPTPSKTFKKSKEDARLLPTPSEGIRIKNNGTIINENKQK
jgi:hypothetical protein